MELTIGMKGEMSIVVTQEVTAAAVGSGMLPVFATPQMIALMELTAQASVADCMPEGCGTVGTMVNVAHSAATPIGMKVRCETELIGIDRRKLTFAVAAYDECGEIGRGTHERFIIDNEKFMSRVQNKRG